MVRSVTWKIYDADFLLLEVVTPYDFVCRGPQLYYQGNAFQCRWCQIQSRHCMSQRILQHLTEQSEPTSPSPISEDLVPGTKKGIIGLST